MKINFENKMQDIIASLSKNKENNTLLLHSCCAPCSSSILEYLKDYFKITIFFYNPNITDKSEYQLRLKEQEEYIKKYSSYGINIIQGDYNPQDDFFILTKGFENSKEGGERCFICYEKRLDETAKLAKNMGFKFFSTVLSISPLKNSNKINEIGEILEKKYNINFLYSDFKKKNRYQRSIEISKKENLYRQNYCGCIFSKLEKNIISEEIVNNKNNFFNNSLSLKTKISNPIESTTTNNDISNFIKKNEIFSFSMSIFFHLLVFFLLFSTSKNNLFFKETSNEKASFTVNLSLNTDNNLTNFDSDSTSNNVASSNLKKSISQGDKSSILSKNNSLNKNSNLVTNNSISNESKSTNKDKSKSKNTTNQPYILGNNGEKIFKNQNIAGIDFSILNSPEPAYPILARRSSNIGTVSIETRFLVGRTGKVEKIEFISGRDDLGFKKEIEKAVSKWEFSPISFNNEPISLYFYKTFTFSTNN